MARFAGFKPEGMRKIATKMGYQGSIDDFDNYLQQNPEKKIILGDEESPLWGKTFKIRLTSKKSGKTFLIIRSFLNGSVTIPINFFIFVF